MVPRSRRTTNGVVPPVSWVTARSAGQVARSAGSTNSDQVPSRWWAHQVTSVTVEQSELSVEPGAGSSPKSANVQKKGTTWGPENTGPVIGWLITSTDEIT